MWLAASLLACARPPVPSGLQPTPTALEADVFASAFDAASDRPRMIVLLSAG